MSAMLNYISNEDACTENLRTQCCHVIYTTGGEYPQQRATSTPLLLPTFSNNVSELNHSVC